MSWREKQYVSERPNPPARKVQARTLEPALVSTLLFVSSFTPLVPTCIVEGIIYRATRLKYYNEMEKFIDGNTGYK